MIVNDCCIHGSQLVARQCLNLNLEMFGVRVYKQGYISRPTFVEGNGLTR